MSKINKHMPYMPWDCSRPVVVATQCVAAGTATSEQQQIFMNWLINDGCKTYDMDWFPEERVSSFAAGRRFVGQQLVRQIKLKVGLLKESKNG